MLKEKDVLSFLTEENYFLLMLAEIGKWCHQSILLSRGVTCEVLRLNYGL